MSAFRELRAASRALEPERVIAALDQVFCAWSAPDSAWRRLLAAALDLYSPPALDLAMGLGLRGWNAAALRAIRSAEVRPHVRAPELTAVWLAGAIPPASFSALALPLLAGSAVYARTSSADPTSPSLFRESLAEIDAGLAEAVRIGDDEAALQEADAVVAFGRDETIAALRARVPATSVFVGYGHRLSVSAIGPRAPVEQSARLAARDIALFDGRGCLSPAYVLVDDTPRGRARELAEALATQLEELRTKLPRGRLLAGEEVRLHELRAGHAMSDATRVWLSRGSTDWGVLLGLEGIRPAPGMLRNVPVVPVSGSQGLSRWCAGLAPHLSSLAVLGWPDSREELAAAALAGGASRLCPLGDLQLPRLEWRHDGRGAIEPLLTSLDVEPGIDS